MPNDIYGNPDPFALFFDARIGTNVWYPGYYAEHPIWSQYLTRVTNSGTPRPDGMHGGSIYQTTSPTLRTTFPGTLLYPGFVTYPGQSIY